jgi:hypothetical protein
MEYFLKNFSELSIDTKGARFAHVLDALPLRCSIGIFSAYENDPLTPATYEEVLAFSGPYLVGLPTVTDTDGASRADGLSVEDLGNNEGRVGSWNRGFALSRRELDGQECRIRRK